MENNLLHCRLEDLPTENVFLATNSQDIKDIMECVGFPYVNFITGALVELGEGGYERVWLCEGSKPYELKAFYSALPHYRDEKMRLMNNLPCYWQVESYKEQENE